jgi:hypothetical protein
MFRGRDPRDRIDLTLAPKERRFGLRWAFVAAVAIAVVANIATIFLRPIHRSSNSLMVLMPYKHAGTWVFDDPAVGLRQEPFVAGIPEMMDEMVKDIPDAEKGFRLLFSTQPFPGYSHKLSWRRGDNIGNWYYSEDYKKEGWLCPGLFKYYPTAPKEIYVKAERK